MIVFRYCKLGNSRRVAAPCSPMLDYTLIRVEHVALLFGMKVLGSGS